MTWSELDEFITTTLKSTCVPSISLALVKNNDVVYARSYGFRDVTKRLPATPQTVYGVASVTKCFTAVAMLQLVEQRCISLETPVEEILPLSLRPFGKPICIHHLLTHTGGIPALDYLESEILDVLQGMSTAPRVADVIAWLNNFTGRVDMSPGEKWLYFNEGYTLLGGIIEKISGISYKEYLRAHVLAPLDMRSTGFLGDHFENFAVPYLVTPEGKVIPTPGLSFPVGSEAGLASCVLDLAKFIICLLNKGRPLISEESFSAMIKPRVTLPRESIISPTRVVSYGYGFVLEPFLENMTLIGHPGGIVVYTSYLGFIPEANVGVVVLANGQGPSIPQLAQVALAYLLGYEPSSLPFISLETIQNKILGLYYSYKGRPIACVHRANNTLYLTFLGGAVPTSLPLFLQKVENDVAYFYVRQGEFRLPVMFKLYKDQIELIYDCYRFRRLERLATEQT